MVLLPLCWRHIDLKKDPFPTNFFLPFPGTFFQYLFGNYSGEVKSLLRFHITEVVYSTFSPFFTVINYLPAGNSSPHSLYSLNLSKKINSFSKLTSAIIINYFPVLLKSPTSIHSVGNFLGVSKATGETFLQNLLPSTTIQPSPKTVVATTRNLTIWKVIVDTEIWRG